MLGMIEFFYFFQRFTKIKKKIFDGYNLLSEIVLNFTYKFYYQKFYKLHKKTGLTEEYYTNSPIIVSITSFPARINEVAVCIETIMSQKMKPNRIILWLVESDFDDKKTLPLHLEYLKKRGLEVKYCIDDLRPHNKYFHSLKENPDSVIITLDDDCYYPNYTLSKLIEAHIKNPRNIICNKCRRINLVDEIIPPYLEWKNVEEKEISSSYEYLPLGVGGVLYPPNSLGSNILNIDDIKNLCLYNDDLWLKTNSFLNKTMVTLTGNFQLLCLLLENLKK
jgi:hypothetical protein